MRIDLDGFRRFRRNRGSKISKEDICRRKERNRKTEKETVEWWIENDNMKRAGVGEVNVGVRVKG